MGLLKKQYHKFHLYGMYKIILKKTGSCHNAGMTETALIFPHQLFEEHPALNAVKKAILVEDYLFFRVQSFHSKRLILLRAAMKAYADYLKDSGIDVTYIPSTKLKSRGDFADHLGSAKKIHAAHPADERLMEDLENLDVEVEIYDTPQFYCSIDDLKDLLGDKKKLYMAAFYKEMRQNHDLLMKDGKPKGGKYSFDADNRKPLPQELSIPKVGFPRLNKYVKAATAYVKKEFPKAVGSAADFRYPTTFKEAQTWLDHFLKKRFKLFGPYEDAIHTGESYLFHSVLSPLLNVGLLTPGQVVDAAIRYSRKHKIPIESVEGFVRQIVGWREFMRGAYELKGSQLRGNFFKYKKKIPRSLWTGDTGIDPIDITIKRVLDTGYAHHIERLMVLGNFMLLCEFHPKEVYEWFMAMFIDAYDWVMVPNVYAMSQYADGGTITTKPYVSSSNYLMKMGNYEKGEWCDIWDGLFWRFVKKHKKLFEKNPRTKAMLGNLTRNKKSIDEKIQKGEKFLRGFSR